MNADAATRHLLLAACTAGLRGGRLPDAPEPNDTDVQALYELSTRHRVTAIVTKTLDIPFLRQSVRMDTRRNVMLAAELARLIAALQRHGIRVLAFKGPSLACLAFGSLGGRAPGDLDLLVSPREFPRALAILRREGLEIKTRHQREVILARHQGPTAIDVELHHSIGSPRFEFMESFDNLWRRRRLVPVAGHEIPTFSPEDLLLVLAHHGSRHRWFRLAWLADIVALLERDTIDGAVILQRAAKLGLRRRLAVALLCCRNLFHWVPPSWAAPLLRDPAAARLAREIPRLLFSATEPLPFDPSAPFHARACDRGHEALALRIAARLHETPYFSLVNLLTITRRDRETVRLPESLEWAYLPLKALRRAWDCRPRKR